MGCGQNEWLRGGPFWLKTGRPRSRSGCSLSLPPFPRHGVTTGVEAAEEGPSCGWLQRVAVRAASLLVGLMKFFLAVFDALGGNIFLMGFLLPRVPARTSRSGCPASLACRLAAANPNADGRRRMQSLCLGFFDFDDFLLYFLFLLLAFGVVAGSFDQGGG